MRHLDLFSGIGGFALGLQRAGFDTVAFCEIEPYAQKVLKKHWPDTPIYEDIHDVTAERLAADGLTGIDIITGGYPCQPFSTSGQRAGEDDDRHLWPQIARLIREFSADRPAWLLFENVAGHVSLGLDRVLSDLDGLGYTSWPLIIPACAVNAGHRRDRVWILANAPSQRQQGQGQPVKPISTKENPYREADWLVNAFRKGAMPHVCGRHYGVSKGMDRLRGLGNAVMPQIPEIIGRAIMDCST